MKETVFRILHEISRNLEDLLSIQIIGFSYKNNFNSYKTKKL